MRTTPAPSYGSVEPAAMSPRHAAAYLSISKRTLSTLIAQGVLVARKANSRTLVDFTSIKNYYAGLPVKTAPAPIPNAPRKRVVKSGGRS
jgi:hypothetical protein